MFRGEFEHSLDVKNRVVLPAALRKEIPDQELREGGLILTIGRRSQWLTLEPKKVWEQRIERLLETYDEDDEDVESYLRDQSASAYDVELDRQYRFVIPDARKRAVGIDTDIVFVGMLRRIEVWDKARYEAYRRSREGKQELTKGSEGGGEKRKP